jgi:GTPase SAR1 family protein
MFVVVGEVKSGKSSFINALLNQPVCKVDPAPCTDTVQEITYADPPTEHSQGPHLKKIGLPLDILKTIAIVDTPGTNTILGHHQEITQGFIPHSDLVIFVFPAKNPHTESAWKLLDFVNKEWHKKVIFVLQQADLADDHELAVNTQSVKQYAGSRQIPHPQIFCTSVKWEEKGDERGGFKEIREYIRETVTGGQHFAQKLLSQIGSAQKILDENQTVLGQEKQQLDADIETANKFKNHLSLGKDRSGTEMDSLIDRLVTKYDNISHDLKNEFREGLAVPTVIGRSFTAIFNKQESIQQWTHDLNRRFENTLKTTIEDISADSARHFIEGVRWQMQNLLEQLAGTRLSQPPNLALAANVLDRRDEMVKSVSTSVTSLLKDDAFARSLRPTNLGNISGGGIGGGALAVIGAIIAAATHTAALDITGGVLAGTGILVAGATLIFKRKSIIRDFEKGLDQGKKQFDADLRDRLTSNLKGIYDELDRALIPLYQHIEYEKQRLLPKIEKAGEIEQKLDRLSHDISAA